jgi:hypothetical protein
MKSYQQLGGAAALFHACAYIVGMILGVALIFPILEANSGQYVAFAAQNETLVYIWNLISYWGSAITLVIMVLALYHRLKTGAPALAQTAAVFGLIWAGLIIASANLMLHDSGVIASLYAKDPAQAAALWPALEAVETGIVSGNELVGSLWVLLISIAALKTRILPRSFTLFGIVISAAGILTLVPGWVETTQMVFGSGMIVWSIWLGIVLLTGSRSVSNSSLDLAVEGNGIA